ncbi:MAG: hypothetical protein K1X78_04950 [Verrucomicrobiaceae bacterium]|nr:hypothetical protein [Verrucomicrobiaceae bacterium]
MPSNRNTADLDELGYTPQQHYQKHRIRPEVQATSSPELHALLALDDPRNDELARSDMP